MSCGCQKQWAFNPMIQENYSYDRNQPKSEKVELQPNGIVENFKNPNYYADYKQFSSDPQWGKQQFFTPAQEDKWQGVL